MPNRLARETSPYLLQHQDNPVDWYPWGEEAFSRAREVDRPILLSVGYSACHWCHVMEHESFSDPETAELMNESFVNIKVDREERPDVDALYMQAVQQMTGRGGWPMTVFLTPDGVPFYGGTYYPPEPRHGLPGFPQLLHAIADAYRSRRDEVERTSADLRDLLARGMSVNPRPTGIDPTLLDRAFHGLASRFDQRFGGFGGAPKFPQPMVLDFLLLYWWRTGNRDAITMAERTLEAMARGGIYDHLGGGFHRYSVDARWLVPHFEKMLYDNALLSRVFLRGYQVTGRPDFRTIVDETLRYVGREMRSDSGGFYSSQDADSEGEEGRFFVWSAEEIDSILGEEAGPIFRAYYGVQPEGNWEGKSILNVQESIESLAGELAITEDRLRQVVREGKELLYQRRAEREWPGRDDKVLTGWNAMMIHSFAEAGRVLDESEYVATAVDGAEFVLRELRSGDRLLRSWRDGTARIDGFLEDHGTLTDALIELYSATYDPRWIREARWVADRMIDRFWSPDEEMFFDTPEDGEALIVRPRDVYDNATPSGTAAATLALIRLARFCGEPEYQRIADRVIEGMGDMASRVPQAFGHLLCAAAAYFSPPTEVAIVGRPEAGDTRAMLDRVRTRFLPFTTIAFRPDGPAGAEAERLVPLLAERPMIDGNATAFVCEHFACKQPVTTVEDLDRELASVLGTPANT